MPVVVLGCLSVLIGSPQESRAAAGARHSSLVVLLDRSGSMRQADGACVRADAGELLLQQLADGDLLTVAEFGEGIQASASMQAVGPATRPALLSALRRCEARDHYTDIAAALGHATAVAQQLSPGQKQAFPVHVLLLTDGRHEPPPGASADRSLDSVLAALKTGPSGNSVGSSGRLRGPLGG